MCLSNESSKEDTEMANMTVTIDLDNAAFEDNPQEEVRRILDTIALRFYEAKDYGKWLNAHDINGNPVAKFKVES